jgi:hypothetical protein
VPRLQLQQLKPANILLRGGNGSPVLVDFGLALEDLDVELLDDIVGLCERLQAGVTAVQEAPGVARQAVAGEFQQPLPGLGVTGHGPL